MEASLSAGLPAEMVASRAGAATAKAASAAEAYSLLAAAHNSGDPQTMHAALSNVTSGPIFEDAGQPQWLGDVWGRKTYTQRYSPLVTHANLTAMTAIGFRWTQGPEVGDWAGFPNEVPSNAVALEPVTVTAAKLASGHVLDRAFWDFGRTDVLDAFYAMQANDYAQKIDEKVIAYITSNSVAVTGGAVSGTVAAGNFAVVDGALALLDEDLQADFAIIGKDVYRDMVTAADGDVFAYINSTLGLEGGNSERIRFIPSGHASALGKVIVGAKEAVTLFELPGASPVRAEALQINNGGVQVGLYGYYGLFYNGRGLVSVTV